MSNLLRNPFYYGVFYHKGVLHQGSHQPMISKATWDEVQRARVAVAKPRKHRTEKGLKFLNFATCGSCGHCITGERHQKKSGREYFYYRCSHKNAKRGCQGTAFVTQDKFADEVRRNVELVTLPDEWREKFLNRVESWESANTNARFAQIDRLRSEQTAIRQKIERLNTAFTDGSIELAEFKELKNPLIARKAEIEAQIVNQETSRTNRVEPVRTWIFEANSGKKLLSDGNVSEMKTFLQKVGLNRIFEGQTLTITYRKPWSALAETVLATRADNEFTLTSEKWWR